MASQTSLSRTPPTFEQVRQQLERMHNDRHFNGPLRFPALEWLVTQKFEGRFEKKPRPPAKQITEEFYRWASSAIGVGIAGDLEGKGKKLFGDLSDALEVYYAGEGTDDPIIINLKGGVGGAYEPLFEWNDVKVILNGTRQGSLANDAVIPDHDLIVGIEANVPDGTSDIWVAAPDLSNVGDEMSPYAEVVRETVRKNASRSVNYTYVCPKGHAGQSRIRNLRNCFVGRPGKLFLYEITFERFCEITLESHFITFNPNDTSPDVYMQLPVPRAHKGWVKIPSEDARRVVEKMRQLMSEYQPD